MAEVLGPRARSTGSPLVKDKDSREEGGGTFTFATGERASLLGRVPTPTRDRLWGAEAEQGAGKAKSRALGGLLINDPAALSSAGAWALNVFSSVSLIVANKSVMKTHAFRFATTLTALHFVMTAGAGLAARGAGQLSATRVPFWTLLWFSLAANASVVTMNLSLMLNSVGFYQIAKLSIIPTCCVFEWLLHGKHFSRGVKFSVVVVVLGVGICTVTDVTVSLFGFVAAACAVLTTTLQQIYVGQLQKTYNIGSFDLLSQTAPVQAVVLVASGPLIDFALTQQNVFNYELSFRRAMAILVSCSLALFVNISTYLCIGKFSAVSFQVLGHMKTILVLALGWTLFDSVITLKNLGGMLMAVVGMVLYSWAVEADRAKAMAAIAAPAAGASPEKLVEADSARQRLLEEGGATSAAKERAGADADAQVPPR